MNGITIKISAVILAIMLAAASPSAGDTAKEKKTGKAGAADTLVHYTMDEIVVTATRIGSPLEDLALSVSILGDKEIGTSLKNSSTDLAGALPGVFIMKTGDFGRSDVNIRGLGSKGRQALVLIDGRPDRMALFDCTVTHSFPLHDVERVEVVKGASSTLYGSGAMGGVMNVIPREVREPFELDLRGSAGTWDTYVTSGRLAARDGAFSGVVSADHRESAGHVENSSYRGTDVTAGGDAALSEGIVLKAYGKYFDGFKEEPLRATDDPSLVSDTWNEYRRGSVDLHLEGEGERHRYGARWFRSFGEHTFSDGWYSKDATDGVTVDASVRPAGRLEISGGADWRFGRGRLPDVPGARWDKWEAGIYAAAEYIAGGVLTLSAGARYSVDEVSGEQVSPSFGAVWRPREGTALRATASQGFRSPAINELYMYPSSNEDLEAESAWNYEAGMRQRIPGGLALDLAVFRMDGSNMIILADNPSPPPPVRFSNTGDFVFDGIEASIEGRWSGGLGGSVSYSYLDTGPWTQGRPGTKVDFEMYAKRGRFTARLSGSHVGDYHGGNDASDPIPSYTIADLYGEGIIAGGLAVFLGIGNIGDEKYMIYTELPGTAAGLYEMPGRSLTGGFRYAY
jgi:outer membrane receptor protein involved in Fe transport